jgi:hypothetical protein
LRLAAQRKVNSYRQQYTDNQNISFLPAIMTTSSRMHGKFLRLLFLQHQEKVLCFNMHVTDANMHVPAPSMHVTEIAHVNMMANFSMHVQNSNMALRCWQNSNMAFQNSNMAFQNSNMAFQNSEHGVSKLEHGVSKLEHACYRCEHADDSEGTEYPDGELRAMRLAMCGQYCRRTALSI